MIYLEESHILLFLAQFFVILLVARAGGELFRAFRQPQVTGELLAGILLGPTVLGRLFAGPHATLFPPDPVQMSMIETVSWLGVLFLLLESGLEIDFSIAWRRRGSALTIALADIVLPMIVAFVPSLFIPRGYLAGGEARWIFALFMAAVMTISAMPVAAKAMHDLNILKTEMGFLIMSALAVNDLIGWVVFTIVLSLFREAGPDVLFLGRAVVFTIGFAAFALWTGPRISTWIITAMHRSKMPEPASSLTFICLLGLLFGFITQLIGIHALFGFFIAGVMVGEAKPISEESRRIISQVVYSVFVPVFFAGIGLKIDFIESFDLPLALFISLVGIAGRFAGAWVGVTMAGTFRNDRRAIAIAHTPGGVMEIVIALLALNSGLITNEVFVGIVFAALLSSTVMGPWLAHTIKRRPPIIMHYVHPRTVIPASVDLLRDRQIEHLCESLAAHAAIDPRHLRRLVLEREREYSTALEDGIAIPHARLEEIKQPAIAYARSPVGIDWNSPDGRPAHHIFLLAMPARMASEQVQILAAIARMMFEPANRAFLDTASDTGSIAEQINRRLASALREQR